VSERLDRARFRRNHTNYSSGPWRALKGSANSTCSVARTAILPSLDAGDCPSG
jgi:hypothetical protein